MKVSKNHKDQEMLDNQIFSQFYLLLKFKKYLLLINILGNL